MFLTKIRRCGCCAHWFADFRAAWQAGQYFYWTLPRADHNRVAFLLRGKPTICTHLFSLFFTLLPFLSFINKNYPHF